MGDSRRELRPQLAAEVAAYSDTTTTRLLQRLNGIGETGASIYLREVQDTWAWCAYFDEHALAAGDERDLPRDVGAPDRNAALAAALVRVTLDDGLRDQLCQSAERATRDLPSPR